MFSVFVPNNLPFFFLFAKFCHTECFNVIPSGFALIFVECFVRVRMLEIIGIGTDGPLVRLPE